MNNLSDWIVEQDRAYRKAGDDERLFISDGWSRAFKFRETDPNQAIQVLHEARQHAEQLGDLYWMMITEHWRLSAMMYFKKDYRQVVELAVQNAVLAAKPEHAAFPGKLVIYSDLALAYSDVDPEGYADEVRKTLSYLDKELPQEPNEDRYLMLEIDCDFHLGLGDLKGARQAIARTMALAASGSRRRQGAHFSAFAFAALCWVACQEGDWRGVAESAEAGEECARIVGHQMELCEFLAWQAVVARREKDELRARRLHFTAHTTMSRIRMPPNREYPDAMMLFPELGGDLDKALQVRDRELSANHNLGRLAYLCEAHVKRCQLLAKMGRLQAADLDAARQAVQKLRKPERWLAEIDKLAAAL
jgi:hypothetical protein